MDTALPQKFPFILDRNFYLFSLCSPSCPPPHLNMPLPPPPMAPIMPPGPPLDWSCFIMFSRPLAPPICCSTRGSIMRAIWLLSCAIWDAFTLRAMSPPEKSTRQKSYQKYSSEKLSKVLVKKVLCRTKWKASSY